MRIALLIESLTSGGRERRLVELIKGFKNYDDVELCLVVFSENIHYREVYDLGIPVKILKRRPKKNPIVFYRLFKIFKKWKPDLIHSWGTMSTIFAIPSAQLLKIKLINANIVNAPKNMRFFDKRFLRARLTFPFSNIILGNSQAGLKAYKVPRQKAICIYNGFGNQRITQLDRKNSVKEKFNIKTNYVVGMVASFTDKKDYSTYIKAAQKIIKIRDDITFIAVGDGPNLSKHKRMITNEMASYFKFTGVQLDVESIVNIFDIGVLTTNTKVHGEGISNSILEYMALGKPTIATTGGGTNEILVHGETGFLIPPEDVDELVDKLIYLIENSIEANTMGRKGRDRIIKEFSLEKMTESYFRLYNKIFDLPQN